MTYLQWSLKMPYDPRVALRYALSDDVPLLSMQSIRNRARSQQRRQAARVSTLTLVVAGLLLLAFALGTLHHRSGVMPVSVRVPAPQPTIT